jgi:predicted small secreted protein
MKRGLLIVILATLPMLLASCNTIEGVGKDIQDGGKAMNKAINGDKSQEN